MQILHLSSNKREQNLALIPDYDPNKKAHPRLEFQAQQNYSSLRTREPSNLDPERHEFWAQQNYSPPRARESPKPT